MNDCTPFEEKEVLPSPVSLSCDGWWQSLFMASHSLSWRVEFRIWSLHMAAITSFTLPIIKWRMCVGKSDFEDDMAKNCIGDFRVVFRVVRKWNKCFDNGVFFVTTPIQLSVKGAVACKTFQYTGNSENPFSWFWITSRSFCELFPLSVKGWGTPVRGGEV